MKKKYYLEAMRILAVLLVMYNHSAPFMSFATQSGLEKNVSFLLSLICKAAVPLFFMISGVLLLGKEESFRDLFQKRILRMIYVIIIFSLLYHFKMAWKGATPFAPLHVFLRLPFDLVFLPYWYLYSYIGFLAILPFVRAIAKHMTKNMLSDPAADSHRIFGRYLYCFWLPTIMRIFQCRWDDPYVSILPAGRIRP